MSVIVRWRGALADARGAAHGARAVALERRALVGVDGCDRRSSPTSSWLCSALATADSSSFAQSFAAARGRVGEDRARLRDVLAADVVADQARLARGGAHVLGLCADLDAGGRRVAAVAAALGRGSARASGSAALRLAAARLGRRLRGGFFAAGFVAASAAAGSSALRLGGSARPRPQRFASLARRPSARARLALRRGLRARRRPPRPGRRRPRPRAPCVRAWASAPRRPPRRPPPRLGGLDGLLGGVAASSATSGSASPASAAASASAATSAASSAAATARAASSSARSIWSSSSVGLLVGHRTLPDFSWPR